MRPSLAHAVRWIAAGGVAYWLPFVFLAAAVPLRPNLLVLNLAPVAGLIVLALVVWFRQKRTPRWGWVLAGIYILGPSAMLLANALTAGPTPSAGAGDWMLVLLICLFPPMTLWLATLNLIIFQLVVVTVALIAWEAYRRSRETRASTSHITDSAA